MEIGQFAELDTLERATQIPQVVNIFKVLERNQDINRLFRAETLPDQDEIEKLTKRIIRKIEKRLRKHEREDPNNIELKRKIAIILRDINTRDRRHIIQDASIGMVSKAITDPREICILEPCCGNSLLQASISLLRVNAATRSMGIDSNPAKTKRFETLRTILSEKDGLLELQIGDIGNFELTRNPHYPTYVLAKHACGSATDEIIASVTRQEPTSTPDKTVIATCCHGSAKKETPYNLVRRIKRRQWEVLAETAEWTNAGAGSETKIIAGRVAMRIMDCLRITETPDHILGYVRELFPESISSKNNGIVLETIN